MEPTLTPIWKRLTRKILLILLISLLSITCIAALALYFFQDSIKAAAITEINKKLNVQVIVNSQDIEITLFSSFPNASVQFSHFQVKESYPGSKALLSKAELLRLEFNPFNLISKKYKIRRIILKDAVLNLKVNEKGEANYLIFKPDTAQKTSADVEPLSLNLKKIILLRVKVNYNDLRPGQNTDIAVNIKETVFKGRFTDQAFDMSSEAELQLNKLKIGGVAYPSGKDIYYNTTLAIDNDALKYVIKEAKLKIDGSAFQISGYAQEKGEGMYLDFKCASEESSIKNLLALLPGEFTKPLKGFESSGKIDLTASITGIASNGTSPQISADFNIRNGAVRYKSKALSLLGVNLEGRFSNGVNASANTSMLSISHFSGKLNGRECSGKLQLSNLADPTIIAALKADINLKDLIGFIDIPGVKSLAGDVNVNAGFNGRISDLQDSRTAARTRMEGTLALRNVSIALSDGNATYSGLNGDFKSNGKDLLVQSFSGSYMHSDFNITGAFKNLSAFLFLPNQPLDVSASLKSKQIDLDDFIQSGAPATANPTAGKPANPAPPSQFNFPAFLAFNLSLDVDKMIYKKLNLLNVSGRASMDKEGVNLSGLGFQAMGGNVTMTAQMRNAAGNKFAANGKVVFKNIDVSQCFYQMDNFGQAQLTDKQIKGVLNATIDFQCMFNSDLSMDLGSLVAVNDISIDKGQLIQFKPMMELGKFLRIKNLDNLYFSKLQNTITIKDKKMIIPKMDINSTAVNMSISGTHTFNNVLDYKMKVNLASVLANKNNYRDEDGNINIDQHGGLNLFIAMSGPIDHLSIKYDKKSSVQNLGLGLKQEGKELKKILTGNKKPSDIPKANVDNTPTVDWGDDEPSNKPKNK